MTSQQVREELDCRASKGETVVPNGTGGKTLDAQERLGEGRIRDGETRKEQLGHKGGLSPGVGQERDEQQRGFDINVSKRVPPS